MASRLLEWVGIILVYSMLFTFLYLTLALGVSWSDSAVYCVYILWALGMIGVFTSHYSRKKRSKRRGANSSL